MPNLIMQDIEDYTEENGTRYRRTKRIKRKRAYFRSYGSTELAANLFRITQTEERLKKGDIQEQEEADSTHYKIGEKVRETMKEISGITPEQLPTPDKSIKQLEHEKKKLLKKK
ncbi:DNA-damage-inducible protein D [Fusobacterium necrophorum subsp. necrophorum]|nr:DNA-damage-inducible protein D [Fusobacterium necrophorum subsp. necrophorum]